MSKLLQLGIIYPAEMTSGIGHVAVTLGGVNYESRGDKGCLKGTAARGATNVLFKHHFYKILSNAQAEAAKQWADSCVGLPYVFGGMQNPPRQGGDCSAYVSGIIQVAAGKPAGRIFSTGTWAGKFQTLGFLTRLGTDNRGPADRPNPGTPVGPGDKRISHVKWIQSRLNIAGTAPKLVVDGDFGALTKRAVVAFQKKRHLAADGICGPQTWPSLNAIA
jgi:hypothetical protein